MSGRRRIALGLEYDGTAYRGFQRQSSPPVASVQAVVEAALSRVADAPVQVTAAGRTDAGVHALGQVVHFDADVRRAARNWVLGTNSYLPDDIAVRWALEVEGDFHARFSALERSYRYLIHCGETRPALLRSRVHWHRGELDLVALRKAADHLLGKHDFSSFRGPGCQSHTPRRELRALYPWRWGDLLVVDFCANAFLQQMVRIITGTLLRVGAGLETPDWVGEVLCARDRARAGATLSPEGLYLTGVRYAEKYAIPAPPALAHAHDFSLLLQGVDRVESG